MKVQINGKEFDLAGEISVSDLLVKNKVESPDMVSVQLNGEFVKKEEFSKTIIKEKDAVDFLYFMGGGM
ncbi:MAG: thiamine biosynthesis protein ThiS [Candidatus Firestonebacteria bacterium RIFOXYC2_FULL_39_67]|nr:MAG: thiamine biosynthesis protein ThiS [Candidatus Firestonebacteria bacterium RIFOXYD2_FULL_39_29]OGF56648.1 MAG: thiamine biosynthesis protein ThiS [Candidatus Firestonebacteria bacterium RIFOXYC2_FULL_39_67]OGF57124.1 MAG: thiamine biosynthesis protein ThiS [Candidatus Firestonebacteria bacterium RifOxyC12_full_39_7]